MQSNIEKDKLSIRDEIETLKSLKQSEIDSNTQKHLADQNCFIQKLEKIQIDNLALQKLTETLQSKVDQKNEHDSSEKNKLLEAIEQHQMEHSKLKVNIEELVNENAILKKRVESVQSEFEMKLVGLTDKSELERLSQVHQVKLYTYIYIYI